MKRNLGTSTFDTFVTNFAWHDIKKKLLFVTVVCAQLTTKYVESPSANLAPRRSTYIHKLAARLLIRPAPRSSHKLAPSVGTSWRLYYRIPSIQAFCRGSKHSPSKCQRQRRARTLSQSAPRTVEQPQACSISRHLMASLVQTTLQVPDSAAETSTHLMSACTLHRGAAVH